MCVITIQLRQINVQTNVTYEYSRTSNAHTSSVFVCALPVRGKGRFVCLGVKQENELIQTNHTN